MRLWITGFALVLTASGALARDYRVVEAPAGSRPEPQKLERGVVAFTDTRGDPLADPATGLVRFTDWERERPVEKRILGPHPGYTEPLIDVNVHGVEKKYREKLHVYVARAQFIVSRPPERIALPTLATLDFLSRLDPSIVHAPIEPTRLAPVTDARQKHTARPDRPWCGPGSVCVTSRYQLEGKLPLGVRLANKLDDSGRKIAEYLDFQSELRMVPDAEIDREGLVALTGAATPVAGVLEQTIFFVNQMMQFGRFVAVFQPHPTQEGMTLVTAFMALGIESDVLEMKKEFERVPVLRNMVPAQVLVGNSSFNTGNSISAGVPVYARNRLALVAGLIDGE